MVIIPRETCSRNLSLWCLEDEGNQELVRDTYNSDNDMARHELACLSQKIEPIQGLNESKSWASSGLTYVVQPVHHIVLVDVVDVH